MVPHVLLWALYGSLRVGIVDEYGKSTKAKVELRKREKNTAVFELVSRIVIKSTVRIHTRFSKPLSSSMMLKLAGDLKVGPLDCF